MLYNIGIAGLRQEAQLLQKKMGNTTRCGITKFRDAPLAQIHPIFSSVVLLACYSLCNNTLDEPLSNLMDY